MTLTLVRASLHRSLALGVLAASSLGLASCGGGAGQAPAPEAPKTEAAVAAAPPAPAPAPPKVLTQEEMMAAWQAAMTPGDAHHGLDAFVGTWDVAASLWMAPGAPPEVSTGASTTAWILGGRYLEQKHVGTAMGQPFEGRGVTGYDNVQKKYIGTWIDTMGTGIMTSLGSVDETGMKFAFAAVMWDPTTGQEIKSREELIIESPDKHVMTMHATDPASGAEFKTMELVFTRAAAKE